MAILPAGATEAHGPHLPLSTDNVIASAMAQEGARCLAKRGFGSVLLPEIAYTAAPFAADFPGTLSVGAEPVTEQVVDLGRCLARQGFACLALASAHLDPAHVGSLREAVERLRQETELPVAFPDMTRRGLASRLTEEFRSGACHAGRFEGSIVLATRPDLVQDELRQALAPNPSSLSAAIRDGKSTFHEAGGPDAYFGDPAAASTQEGRETIELLGRMLEEAVMEALETGPT